MIIFASQSTPFALDGGYNIWWTMARSILYNTLSIGLISEELAKTTEIVFKMQAIAGFFVFGMVLLSSLSVLIYCFYIKRK